MPFILEKLAHGVKGGRVLYSKIRCSENAAFQVQHKHESHGEFIRFLDLRGFRVVPSLKQLLADLVEDGKRKSLAFSWSFRAS